ncbi:serine/threonine-protein phosphatase PGAM5, mitochondrial-like isoform X2 [Rhopilema esculentum]|uniref:serine/threonine-protein phosphatase PGAM5, mitochondrial-like isoform X2 n=1 Tax=Rhopilema esculentum TaxID=499914 RepID=UPI0031CE1CE2
MARFRASFGRILTIGGLTAATSSVAVYNAFVTDRASAQSPILDAPVETLEERLKAKQWDSDWDRRNFGDIKRIIASKNLNVIDDTVLKKNFSVESDSSSGEEDATEDKIKKPKATRHLIFVRHGQYNSGKSDDEKTLTDLGRKQAINTGNRLKSLNIKFDRIVHSTMTRAKETAELIKESLDDVSCESCSLLREGAPCPPEPSSSSNWKPERWYFQDGSRIEAAFRKYIHRADVKQTNDSHELIVCHANVIRYFVCRALQFPPEGWLRMSIANCGLTQLTIRPNGRVSLKSLGDAGHLPPDQITFK